MRTQWTRRIFLAVAGLTLGVARGDGIDVGLDFAHGVYVLGEPVHAVIRLSNRGTRPFIVDDYAPYDRNRVHFDVRRQQTQELPALTSGSIVESLMLMPGQSESFRIDLTAFFPLAQEGRYRVHARVDHEGTGYLSVPRMFDVVPGMKVLEKSHILPDRPSVRRSYRLVYWPRGQTEQLFLRARDEPGAIHWRTIALGPLVRNNPVRMNIGDDGMITIWRQTSRDLFVTSVIESRAEGLRLVSHSQDEDFSTTPLRRMLHSVRQSETAGEGEASESEAASESSSERRRRGRSR